MNTEDVAICIAHYQFTMMVISDHPHIASQRLPLVAIVASQKDSSLLIQLDQTIAIYVPAKVHEWFVETIYVIINCPLDYVLPANIPGPFMSVHKWSRGTIYDSNKWSPWIIYDNISGFLGPFTYVVTGLCPAPTLSALKIKYKASTRKLDFESPWKDSRVLGLGLARQCQLTLNLYH